MKCSVFFGIIILLHLTSCIQPASNKHVEDISMQEANNDGEMAYMRVSAEQYNKVKEIPTDNNDTVVDDEVTPVSDQSAYDPPADDELTTKSLNPTLPSLEYRLSDADHTEKKESIRNKIPNKTSGNALHPMEQEIYSHVNEMPQFPGGEEQLKKWLQANLTYPVSASDNRQQGKVTVRFVVYPDGSIGEIQIKRGVNPALDKEALRVMNMMPDWIPGKLDDRPVPVWCALPIVFKLQEYDY